MPAGTGLLGARRRWLQTPIGAVRGFLALDTHDNPNIAYVTSYVDVMYANWTGTVWSSQKVGTVPEADGPCYLALDSSGIPHISFRGYVSGQFLQGPNATIFYATATEFTEPTQPSSPTSPALPLMLVSAAVVIGAAVTVVVYVWKKKP